MELLIVTADTVTHIQLPFLTLGCNTPGHSVVEYCLGETRVAVYERVLITVGRILIDRQTVEGLVAVNKVLGRVGTSYSVGIT